MISLGSGIRLKSGIKLKAQMPYTPQQVFTNNGSTITDYKQDYGNIVNVPPIINGYPIIYIGDNAFDSTNIKYIKLPEGILTIGSNAFYGCPLQTIILPKTLMEIKNNAFQWCASLTFIVFPYSLRTIGNGCISDCTLLNTIKIGNNVRIGNDNLEFNEYYIDMDRRAGTYIKNLENHWILQ